MASFLSLVFVFIWAAIASNVQSDGTSAVASVSQIRDTLQNLLRSIQDSGRDSEELFEKRQLWCDSVIHDFEAANQASAASLLDMQARLTETQATVEEAEGTVQQVQVDIEMVQHTIKQTEDMLKEHRVEDTSSSSLMQMSSKADAGVLEALVENKRLSLTSLQEELEVTVPVMAQLQSTVAETKQRIGYRTDSMAVAKDFVSALKDGCQRAADRAETQAAARVGETNTIHVALQALNEMGVKASSNQRDEDSQDGQSKPLSFVQVVDGSLEVSTDDLSDLFAAATSEHRGVSGTSDSLAARSRGQLRLHATTLISTAPSLRPRIQTLLNQLKEGGSKATGSDQAAWCSKQRESSAMALKFAQDSVAQVSSEMDAHTDSEAEFTEELQRLKTFEAAVTESAKKALEQAGKEKTLIQSSQKDQVLATKILDQAMTILKELGLSNSTKATMGLKSARKMLAAQMDAAVGFEREASEKATAIGQTASALTNTQVTEQHNLEIALDDHTSQRVSAVAKKQLYEADVQEATSFAQKLAESCKADAGREVEQQRTAQMQALKDADMALTGKLVEAKGTVNHLRAVAKPESQNLTPMQRAAMEMGLALD